MALGFDLLSCIALPAVGYICMKEMKRRAEKAIASKVFAEGMYRFKPVYGDRVESIAKGYARGGVYIFILFIILPVSMTLLKCWELYGPK